MAQGHKHATLNAPSCGFDSRGNEICNCHILDLITRQSAALSSIRLLLKFLTKTEYIYQLYSAHSCIPLYSAVFRTQQDRQREHSDKTLRSPPSNFYYIMKVHNLNRYPQSQSSYILYKCMYFMYVCTMQLHVKLCRQRSSCWVPINVIDILSQNRSNDIH